MNMDDPKLREAESIANRELEECEHQFTFYGYAEDGTCFFRCRKCKKQTDE